MSRIWSEEGKLARWLEVELAALDGWAEIGAIPADDVAAIRAARDGRRRPSASPRSSATTDHDTAAFVDAVTEQLGPEGRWVHYGLTSSDVVDTALALQIQDAGRLVLAGLDRAIDAVVAPRRGAPPLDLHRPDARDPRRADDVRLEARRLGVRARPRPHAARRARSSRTASASSRAPSGRTRGLDPEVERIACERLGLEPDPLSTQVIARDRHAELLSALALTATSLERFATEIRHLARTEVREVEEPFAHGDEGLVGDAAQAQPEGRRADLRPRARRARRRGRSGSRTSSLWHERDISQSSAERVVDPRRVPRARLHARPVHLDRRRPRRLSRSGCSGTSTPRTGSSSRTGCCSRSSSRACRATRPTGSCSGTRCRPGTRSATSARSSRPTREITRPARRRRARRRLRPRSDRPARRHRASTGCAPSPGRRTRQCLKPPATSRAARFARSTRSTTSACCSSRATGSRRSTSCCRPRSPTRAAC